MLLPPGVTGAPAILISSVPPHPTSALLPHSEQLRPILLRAAGSDLHVNSAFPRLCFCTSVARRQRVVTWNGRALPRRQRTVGMYAWHASLDVPACDTPRSCATNSCTGLFHTHGACGAFHSFECAPNESSLSIALLHVFVLHAGDLLLGLGVDLGGDTIAILLALEGHLATTLGKLLNHTDLLELLEAAADEAPRRGLEAARALPARLLVAVHLREPTHAGALAAVEAAGERGAAHVVPVLVVGSELLEGARLHELPQLGLVDLTLLLQVSSTSRWVPRA
mmetsp:Transcript_3539/g.8890  ORF Transcript_3539/g.8890 Transcript_3539/m.8890 type:complete len:281 (+) Transcript_3539:56-898(+)